VQLLLLFLLQEKNKMKMEKSNRGVAMCEVA
jgi:hypothetical protein